MMMCQTIVSVLVLKVIKLEKTMAMIHCHCFYFLLRSSSFLDDSMPQAA